MSDWSNLPLEKRQQRILLTRIYRKNNPDKVKVWARNCKIKNRDRNNAIRRKISKTRRIMVLSHYSNGTPHCKCCGETQRVFLTRIQNGI